LKPIILRYCKKWHNSYVNSSRIWISADVLKFNHYAHRRYGKTSLIKVLSNKLKKNRPSIKTFYIDLYGTLDEKDFIEAIFSSFAQAETKIEKLANTKMAFTDSTM